jgi:hypothetical protein
MTTNGNGTRQAWEVAKMFVPIVTAVNLMIAGFLLEQTVHVWAEVAELRVALASKEPLPEVRRWLERHDREISALQKKHEKAPAADQ